MDGRPGSIFIVGICMSIVGCTTLGPTGDPSAPTSGFVENANGPPSSPYVPGAPQAVATDASPPSPYLSAKSTATPADAHAPSSSPNGSSSNGPSPTGTSPTVAETKPAETKPVARSTTAGQAASLDAVAAELHSLEGVDPAMKRQLIADLQKTDPALWPMMLQTFRAGMKYRERAEKPQSVAADSTGAKRSSTPSKVNWKSPAESESPTATSAAKQAAAKLAVAEESSTARFIPNVDALGSSLNIRNNTTPGLSFPASSLLTAALTEAQRREERPEETPPDAVGEIETKADATLADAGSQDDSPSVKQASFEQPLARSTAPKRKPKEDRASDDWSDAVGEAIVALEAQTREPPRSESEVSRHAWLRVLYLAAGRRDDALKPIPGIAAAQQDYWTEQLYALATYLDTERQTDAARRSAEAAQHLAKATTRLGEASLLVVKNMAFCTEVSGYGVVTKFKDDSFKAGQQLILYAEVENFKSEESAKGFHTAIRSSYQILDAQGRRVTENDLAVTEEHCQNRRRDYFIRYYLSVPDRIYPGKYTLQLTIVDTLSQKIGQSTVDFTVVEK